MATTIAYVLTGLAIFFAVTGLPQMMIGGLLGRLSGPGFGVLVGGLLGGVIAWVLVDFLWVWLEGGHVPIVALGAALVFLFGHGFVSKEELTETSHRMMAGEAWAIILVGVYLLVAPDVIRWY